MENDLIKIMDEEAKAGRHMEDRYWQAVKALRNIKGADFANFVRSCYGASADVCVKDCVCKMSLK